MNLYIKNVIFQKITIETDACYNKGIPPSLMFLSFGFGFSVLALLAECIYHAKFDLDSNEPDNQSITRVQSARTIEQEAENKFGDDETVTQSSA